MERQVGKYTIYCTEQEVTMENYFQHTVFIETQNSAPISLFGGELFFDQAAKLRYSNSESEITETLKEIVRNREDTIWKLKNMITEN